MLITCPECSETISDKAINCPHCGYPMSPSIKPRIEKRSKRMRLPNGFGQITKISDRPLRNPYRAMVTVGTNPDTGRPICKLLKPKGYFKTYNEAYAALAEYHKNPYDLSKISTLSDVYNKWYPKYYESLASSTVRNFERSWNKCSSIHNTPVRAIKISDIRECLDAYPKDAKRIKVLLDLVFDYAMEHELVDKNVARSISYKFENINVEKPHITYTDEEMSILWANTSNETVKMILIQCYSGWRPLELVSLRIEDVNINDRTYTGGVKTAAGKNRTVPIHSKISEFVEYFYDKNKDNGTLFGITTSAYTKRFHRLHEKLGLNINHRPHDPRKHFVTMAKKSDVDEYAIKKIVGHTISDLTEKVYTDRDVEWLRREIEKV